MNIPWLKWRRMAGAIVDRYWPAVLRSLCKFQPREPYLSMGSQRESSPNAVLHRPRLNRARVIADYKQWGRMPIGGVCAFEHGNTLCSYGLRRKSSNREPLFTTHGDCNLANISPSWVADINSNSSLICQTWFNKSKINFRLKPFFATYSHIT